MNRLNLGCGFDKREGFINADSFQECSPDVLMNIESFPWPFEDDQFDYILMKHVLEHVGASFADFRLVMRELYRVLKPGGRLEIHVPDYRHATYWSDPTHVRPFTVLTFEMMSRKKNDGWIANRANYSMIAYALGVDFEVETAVQVYDPGWLAKETTGQVTRPQLREMAATQWGVVKELHVTLTAVKPFGAAV